MHRHGYNTSIYKTETFDFLLTSFELATSLLLFKKKIYLTFFFFFNYVISLALGLKRKKKETHVSSPNVCGFILTTIIDWYW